MALPSVSTSTAAGNSSPTGHRRMPMPADTRHLTRHTTVSSLAKGGKIPGALHHGSQHRGCLLRGAGDLRVPRGRLHGVSELRASCRANGDGARVSSARAYPYTYSFSTIFFDEALFPDFAGDGRASQLGVWASWVWPGAVYHALYSKGPHPQAQQDLNVKYELARRTGIFSPN